MRFAYTVRVGPADIGRRVTIRARTADGSLSDTIGTLEECDDAFFAVRTKLGELVRIERSRVVAAKVIPNRGVRGDSRSERSERSPPDEKG